MGFFSPAGFEQIGTKSPSLQLFAGEAPIITDSAPALVDVQQYEVLALTETGVRKIDLVGDEGPPIVAADTGMVVVIAAQTAKEGQQCPYYDAGKFNHAALTWPDALDTLAKRKAFVHGTMLHMGHLN